MKVCVGLLVYLPGLYLPSHWLQTLSSTLFLSLLQVFLLFIRHNDSYVATLMSYPIASLSNFYNTIWNLESCITIN